MEPIPEARSSLPPVRFFHGGSGFLCHHTHKISGNYKLSPFHHQKDYGTKWPTSFSWSQYPEANPELSFKVRTACCEISSHYAKTLRELATAIRMMTVPSPANNAMAAAIKAAKGLRSELPQDAALLQVMHVAVTASLLSDLVTQIKKIAESVDNLARLAHFKNPLNVLPHQRKH